ncbi:MAG: hypothetical protein R3Y46_03680 [Opitutales bacterium]
MIVSAVQKGGLIYIYDEKGRTKTRNGILVSFTGTSISYKTSKTSKTILVLDDKLKRIRTISI